MSVQRSVWRLILASSTLLLVVITTSNAHACLFVREDNAAAASRLVARSAHIVEARLERYRCPAGRRTVPRPWRHRGPLGWWDALQAWRQDLPDCARLRVVHSYRGEASPGQVLELTLTEPALSRWCGGFDLAGRDQTTQVWFLGNHFERLYPIDARPRGSATLAAAERILLAGPASPP